MLPGLDGFQMPAAIGGRGDRLILNQLCLVVHTVNYLMCFLEVRVGARSQEDRILPSTSKILCLSLRPKSSKFLMHFDIPSRDKDRDSRESRPD